MVGGVGSKPVSPWPNASTPAAIAVSETTATHATASRLLNIQRGGPVSAAIGRASSLAALLALSTAIEWLEL